VIGVIDYGAGNLRSISRALDAIDAEHLVTSDGDKILGCSSLLLPGVGSFPAAMSRLGELGLVNTIQSVAESGRRVVGICLGMQLLFQSSDEHGGAEGLGLIQGEVTKIPLMGSAQSSIGWRQVSFVTESIATAHSLFFAHSYHAVAHTEYVIASYRLGQLEIIAAVKKDNLVGLQFHPEKSGAKGLEILEWALKGQDS
jgi:imidazole glycerol-phosphate synthase subunit HisH